TRDKHRTDHQVCICHGFGDVHGVGSQSIKAALVSLFEFSQTFQVQINDLHIGTHTGGNNAGCFTSHTTTNHHNVGTTGSGNTTHQHTGATLRLGGVVCTGHRGKPAGHLTHGSQQRQCTTTGHSFVCVFGELGIHVDIGAFSSGRHV